MVTLSTLIDRTLNHLDRTSKPARNKLAAAVTDSATTWTFDYDLNGISAGARVSCELEDVHVWSTDTSAKSAVVERGDGESVAAAHADGAVVYVTPEWSRFQVLQAINEEIADLSSPAYGLFQMLTTDLTYSAAVQGYDLSSVTNFLEIYEIRYKRAGSSKVWPQLRSFDVSRHMDTDEFASGTAVFLHEPAESGQTIRVRYKAKFTQLGTTDESQVVETVTGLSESGVNILPYGAAARLAAGRPVGRASMDAQGNARRAEEVSTSDVLGSANALLRLREIGVQAEKARLAALYPPRIR